MEPDTINLRDLGLSSIVEEKIQAMPSEQIQIKRQVLELKKCFGCRNGNKKLLVVPSVGRHSVSAMNGGKKHQGGLNNSNPVLPVH